MNGRPIWLLAAGLACWIVGMLRWLMADLGPAVLFFVLGLGLIVLSRVPRA